jgi:phosphoribosylformimino-5-aminoimidazole carboxamide ribotide isomerase
MQIVGVIDILGGRAVHARGGRRAGYRPIASVAGRPVSDGDPGTVAGIYVSDLGLADVYVADLDAIGGGARQQPSIAAIRGVTPSLWLDSGVTTLPAAEEVLAAGASRIVVGLETLTSFAALEEICRGTAPRQVVFSLDLRHGIPIGGAASAGSAGHNWSDAPETIAARAESSGAGAIVILDVGRVGMGGGCDLELVRRVRNAVGVPLYAGGGVRDRSDLERLEAAGCDGALVATALLNGTLDGQAREDPALR